MIRSICFLAILLAIPPGAHAEDQATADSFLESFRRGKPQLDLRYRYENVADDALGEPDAHASTLRTVLGFHTLSFKGLRFHIEAENVSVLGNDLYDNGGAVDLWNGVTDRPVVADPALTEINQVLVEYGRADSTVKAGRVEFNVGEQRFVGNVGWRQNHQSFKALWFENQSLDRAKFFYSYLDKVYRVNGAIWDTSTHLANSNVKLGKGLVLTPYVYVFDFENQAQVGLSSQNLGLQLTGTRSAGPVLLDYEAEYADQSDYGTNPNQLRAHYAFLHLGARFERLRVDAGYEVLSGSAADGQFNTPLATLHKFNGWADKFLTTPVNGLVDLHLKVSGKVVGLEWAVIYHDFSAETGGASYGNEFDGELAWVSSWDQRFAVTVALYDASTFAADTSKLWLWTSWGI